MSKSFARDKGARGERSAIALLQPVVNACYEKHGLVPPTLARNSLQSRFGGFDIVGVDWLALEIKNQEKENRSVWWEQTKIQAIKAEKSLGKTYYGPLEPVLMYKANRVAWRVMMHGYLPAGSKRLKATVDISADAFLAWFKLRLTQELDSMCKLA